MTGLRIETDGPLRRIVLARPERRNAFDAGLIAELTEAFSDVGDARAVLLSGEGKSFSAGADVEWMRASAELDYDENLADAERLRAMLEAIDTCPAPVVTAVQGHALGGGCELAMFCDLTIAAEGTLFGEPEILFSQVGPAVLMPFIIGHKRARELIYFGDKIDAKRALEIGMINRVVPREELITATMKYAKRLALIAPEALVAAKLAVNRGLDAAGFHNALNAGLDVLGPLYAATTEVGKQFDEIKAKDGLKAALAWRKAQFEE
jgi:enoyl-CoA hydratase/carnithine racemase